MDEAPAIGRGGVETMATRVVATVFFVFCLVKIGEENEGEISRRRKITYLLGSE